ncbi:hypothetical protein KFL_002150060 [Klebsormidium nitens]|uniref:Uncharacterized protein n=1 Tax=Klebsormidium nitens TaxID=105231 RepID=A0A1Y1I218_KLENI|nr:hypothetical protein KFL_002150060 [Klebsormidium nitens]|eukprot:GAQ84970.1 hypothetical protein KFL_002150060 [Klebsormidium nitens]
MEQCAEWNSIPVPSGEKSTCQGSVVRPDEQELVKYRQRASGWVDKDRYLSEYLAFEGQASYGQEVDIEAGWGASRDEKQTSNDMGDQPGCLRLGPLFLTKDDRHLSFALQEVDADSDPQAKEFDRLIVNAAMATRELNTILKAGASDRPRQRKTYDPSRVLFVRS